MVSRKSTKKTFWVLFFAIAVVILLGLFFYFYSGVYEGMSNSSKFYDLLYSSGRDYYDNLDNNIKKGIENELNKKLKLYNSVKSIYDKKDSIIPLNENQITSINNFASAFTLPGLTKFSQTNQNSQFKTFMITFSYSEAINKNYFIDIISYLSPTPTSTSNYKTLLNDFVNKQKNTNITKKIKNLLINSYSITKSKINYSNSDSDYKSIYFQILYSLQFIVSFSNNDQIYNFYNNFINNTSYPVSLLLILANNKIPPTTAPMTTTPFTTLPITTTPFTTLPITTIPMTILSQSNSYFENDAANTFPTELYSQSTTFSQPILV
jgi:hypothetical protein